MASRGGEGVGESRKLWWKVGGGGQRELKSNSGYAFGGCTEGSNNNEVVEGALPHT
jgi:hypothetical protein